MAEKTEFLQAIDDAILDADSLERFINGSDSETVLTRLSVRYPTLQKALKELFEHSGIAGRFKTVEQLQNKGVDLTDGSYALVADDVDDKNGIYIKEGAVWVKSKYDPVSNTLDKIDKRHSKVIVNQIPVVYKKGSVSDYDAIVKKGGVVATNTDGRYAVLKVKPSTTYYVAKKGGKRFAVYGYTQDPSAAGGINTVQALVGYDSAGGGARVDEAGNLYQDAVVTTDAKIEYIVVYGVEPAELEKDFVVQVTEGSAVVPFVSVNKYELSSITANGVPLIPKSKNTLYNAEILKSSLSIVSDKEVFIAKNNGLTVLKTRVKQGHTYKLSGLDVSKLIIFLSEQDVSAPPSGLVYVDGRVAVNMQNKPTVDSVEFNVKTETFAYIYIAGDLVGSLPKRMYLQDIGDAFVKNKNNARYLEFGLDDVYTSNRISKLPANDDTAFLQSIFDAGGVVNLDGAMYKISSPVTIDITKVKHVNGNGATIVSTHSGVALQIIGNHEGSADPFTKTAMTMLSSARVIEGLRVTSASGFSGTGVTISKTFMLDLDIQVMFMQHGIVINNLNRNMRLRPKIYSVMGDGLKFSASCNMHQAQIYDIDINYCEKAIFIDTAELYNIQFLGGDIESSFVMKKGQNENTPYSERAAAKSLVHIKTGLRSVQDILFADITFEDHGVATEGLIILETKKEQGRFIRFADCFYANSLSKVFDIDSVYGLSISGFSDENFKVPFVKVKGESHNIHIDINCNRVGTILDASGDFTLHNTNLKVTGSELTSEIVNADCNINGFILNGSCFTVRQGVSSTPITLGGALRTVNLANISNNTFNLPQNVPNIISIVGTASNCIVQGNIANKTGQYPANGGGIISKDNYAASN